MRMRILLVRLRNEGRGTIGRSLGGFASGGDGMRRTYEYPVDGWMNERDT